MLSPYNQLLQIISQRVLFLVSSEYFLKAKDRKVQDIRIKELMTLLETQRGKPEDREKKIQEYAHFERPLSVASTNVSTDGTKFRQIADKKATEDFS